MRLAGMVKFMKQELFHIALGQYDALSTDLYEVNANSTDKLLYVL